MQNHTLPTPLAILAQLDAPVTSDSEARWARANAKTCLIFVHGFGGRAVGTWGAFPEMAMSHPAFASTDLVFLGYESRARNANYSSSVIFHAVKALAERPQEVLRAVGGPERGEAFAYDQIVLVGHSLGGALVRDVAMSAKLANLPWAEKLQLALFAPAHMGASAIGLAQMGVGFLNLGLVRAAIIVASPVLRDLEEGSDYLKGLLETA